MERELFSSFYAATFLINSMSIASLFSLKVLILTHCFRRAVISYLVLISHHKGGKRDSEVII